MVIGGGVGGLTAAQELAERNTAVSILERNDRFGGKARSMPIADTPDAVHGEHGFRFFPGYYRHVLDTMGRIPDGNTTVADNLVETSETLIAEIDTSGRVVETSQPQSIQEWIDALQPAFAEDLPRQDVRFLIERLLYLLTACDRRREEQLDNISWWEFIDAENRSQEFQERLAYAVQSLVALQPERGSARTVGTIYLQLLFGQLDPMRPSERILSGPTNITWIDPWTRYLEREGVRLRPETTVTNLRFDPERGLITGVELDTGEMITADEYVLAVPVEGAPELLTSEMIATAPELSGIEKLDTAWMNGIQFYLSEDVSITRGHQVYADSPWALTSISQRQFWSSYDIKAATPDEVAGVLSVIVSDWVTPGILYDKPARDCTRQEIIEEVWAQLQAHLDDVEPRLTDELLVDWFLDPELTETATGVQNNAPLLINTVGSLKHRPPADPSIDNLTLASDYVRTNSDLASMESANEAGRRAANAILRRHGYTDTAAIWELSEPSVFDPFKKQDQIRYRLGLSHPAETIQSLRAVANRLRNTV